MRKRCLLKRLRTKQIDRMRLKKLRQQQRQGREYFMKTVVSYATEMSRKTRIEKDPLDLASEKLKKILARIV